MLISLIFFGYTIFAESVIVFNLGCKHADSLFLNKFTVASMWHAEDGEELATLTLSLSSIKILPLPKKSFEAVLRFAKVIA